MILASPETEVRQNKSGDEIKEYLKMSEMFACMETNLILHSVSAS